MTTWKIKGLTHHSQDGGELPWVIDLTQQTSPWLGSAKLSVTEGVIDFLCMIFKVNAASDLLTRDAAISIDDSLKRTPAAIAVMREFLKQKYDAFAQEGREGLPALETLKVEEAGKAEWSKPEEKRYGGRTVVYSKPLSEPEDSSSDGHPKGNGNGRVTGLTRLLINTLETF